MMRCLALLIVLTLGCSACARTPHAQPAAGAATTNPVWQSPLDRDNPLVGRIWDVSRQRYVEERALRAQVAAARFVLIGEQHDNPDHHALQARLLGDVITAGRRPAVVFEMIGIEQQPLVEESLRTHPGDADALARAVDWKHSGWPAFALYRPVFARALAAGLPILGAGIDRDAATRIAREGSSALPPGLVRTFGLAAPLPAGVQARRRQEMADVHCGLLPESLLDGMVLVQRARDAYLAERLHEGAELTGGAVLIAGAGHVRDDHGVPAALARAYGAPSLAIGLVEVRHGIARPDRYAEGYGADRLPFTYVWFTPRANDVDRCEALRKSMVPPNQVDDA